MTILNRSLLPFTLAICLILAGHDNPARGLAAQDACAEFNSWIWAQTVFDADPEGERALDPDGNDIACEALPDGIAPVTWTDAIPADAEPVNLITVNDGDTIEVWLNDQHERVRLVGIDTHEVGGGYQQQECYGPEASRFLKALLNVGGEIWIEQDVEDRDQYGRLLRWVWADFGTGEVYLLNEALVRAGFAERYRNTPNDLYLNELMAAEEFARDYGLGLWEACGLPNGTGPSSSLTSDTQPWPAPALTNPEVTQPPSSSGDGSGCDPSYPEVCIPPFPPDLSCTDVPYDHIRVLPPDPHRLDGNGDGVGCEGPPG